MVLVIGLSFVSGLLIRYTFENLKISSLKPQCSLLYETCLNNKLSIMGAALKLLSVCNKLQVFFKRVFPRNVQLIELHITLH